MDHLRTEISGSNIERTDIEFWRPCQGGVAICIRRIDGTTMMDADSAVAAARLAIQDDTWIRTGHAARRDAIMALARQFDRE